MKIAVEAHCGLCVRYDTIVPRAASLWPEPVKFPANVTAGQADDRGFDFLSFPVNDKSQEPYGDFTDERIVQAGANFISRSRNRPFLLAVSMHNPHDICYWIPGALPKE